MNLVSRSYVEIKQWSAFRIRFQKSLLWPSLLCGVAISSREFNSQLERFYKNLMSSFVKHVIHDMFDTHYKGAKLGSLSLTCLWQIV